MTPSLRTKRHLERATKVRLRGLRANVEGHRTRPLPSLDHETTWEMADDDATWWPFFPRRNPTHRVTPRCIRVTLERRTAYPPHGVRVVTGCSEDVETDCRDLRRATEAALVALDDAEREGLGLVELSAASRAKSEALRAEMARSGAVGLLQFDGGQFFGTSRRAGAAPEWTTASGAQIVRDIEAVVRETDPNTASLDGLAAQLGLRRQLTRVPPPRPPLFDPDADYRNLFSESRMETDAELRARLLRRLEQERPLAPHIEPID